ncbi:MAG: hypothetical protein MZV64_10650 [Ignavibacteriales bacterium]|nr:hypothetical protein [Ignavibacteriales bacterium]
MPTSAPRHSCCGWSRTAWATCSGAITQAKLDEQRGVVQNEKRQYENEPYGVAEELHRQGHLSRRATPTPGR